MRANKGIRIGNTVGNQSLLAARSGLSQPCHPIKQGLGLPFNSVHKGGVKSLIPLGCN